jgi:hypothetical protein
MGPKIDVDSGIEWYNWLKNNQPFYGDYFEKYSISNNIGIIKDSGLYSYSRL